MTVEIGYYCKECNSPAIVKDGVLIRSCMHTTTVIAECEAHVTANGGVSVEPSPSNG